MTTNILAKRKIFYIISLIVLIPGLFSFAFRGLNLGIDFTGGSLVQIAFQEETKIEVVREIVGQHVEQTPYVQETGENTFFVRTTALTEDESNAIIAALTEELGENEIQRNELVGPVIGQELTYNAVWALLLASLLMVGYITWRFEFKFAVAAICALLHDVFVTIGIFSLFQIEVDSAFVAAILSIIGYSINDTIVIFDRIRENMEKERKGDVEKIASHSIWQTFARSINTALTTLLTLGALFIFGGETTKVFALALIIGIISGAYSSMFTASPLWVELKTRVLKKA